MSAWCNKPSSLTQGSGTLLFSHDLGTDSSGERQNVPDVDAQRTAFVKTVIVASALAFLMAGPGYALIIPCETFDRSNTGAVQPVRDYLDDSKGLFVRVCSGGDHLLYFGASNIVRDGNVCRYSEYGLNLSRTSPPRLERTAKPPQTYMLVSESSTVRHRGQSNTLQRITSRRMFLST